MPARRAIMPDGSYLRKVTPGKIGNCNTRVQIADTAHSMERIAIFLVDQQFADALVACIA